jgi:hypothetical protein
MKEQFEVVDEWLTFKRVEAGKATVTSDQWKIIEDTLTRSPYSIPAIYSCLKEENNPLTVKERMRIIEKAMTDISPMYYGRFKMNERIGEFRTWMIEFEGIGRAEKTMIGKLTEVIDKVEGIIAPLEGFASIDNYQEVELALFTLIKEGNL